MELDTYQKKAKTTAIYPDDFKLLYPLLGLNSEVGELAGKLKKIIRDESFKGVDNIEFEIRWKLAKELGDVLWYVAAVADDLGFNLSTIALDNLIKLQSRAERNKIGGSGDDR